MWKNSYGQIRSGWKIIMFLVFVYSISGLFSPLTNLLYTSKDTHVVFYLLLCLLQLLPVLLTVFVWKKFVKKDIQKMGLTPISKSYKNLVSGMILGFISITIIVVVSCVLADSGINLQQSFRPDSGMLLGLVFMSFAAFSEEIMLRGFITTTLAQTKNYPVMLIVPAAIFSILHAGNTGYNLVAAINIFLIGLFLTLMYIKTGNLWMSIGFHWIWNYTQGYIFTFSVSGLEQNNGLFSVIQNRYTVWSGTEFGPESGMLATCVILVSLFIVLRFKHIEKPMSLNFAEECESL